MRWAALAVAVGMVGCGPGIQTEEPPTTVVNPPCEVDCTPITPVESLWPLSANRSWTYRITDPFSGQSTKVVTVVDERLVPGTDRKAWFVKNVEPLLEEHSYQLEDGKAGLVWRLREDDFRDGTKIRVTTWLAPGTTNPVGTVKGLSAQPRETPWSHSVKVTERVEFFDGLPPELKDKDFTWTLLGLETVTVPAGTFKDAVKIRRERVYTDKASKERLYWLVPGVGKVKEDGERLEELQSFTK